MDSYGEVTLKNGRILQVLSDRFAVDIGESVVYAKSRKKLKRELLPLPGDIVVLEQVDGEFVLKRIEPRKSRIVRPPIANPDQILITLAPVPAVEFLTIDKMIVNAHKEGIRTVLCVNKTDITDNEFLDNIFAQYKNVTDELITVCAAKRETAALEKILVGRFSCFAGQSAVGKTSLINAVCGTGRKVGGLSEKTMRGKNTTTGVEILKIGVDTYIADTPGFASLDLSEIEPPDLPLYYDEYVRRADDCKYRMCTHTTEPDCAVRRAVNEGALHRERYERYLQLLDELKIRKTHRKSWRKAYDD